MLQDEMGRLPLHVAAKWGASYRLIVYLVEKDPRAASVKDKLGKTPLHLLCENYTQSTDLGIQDVSTEVNMIEAARALIRAAPDSVNIEDNDEMTAIEYAIQSDAPLKVVRLIQKASERDWKDRKSSMPGESHVSIEEKLVRDQQQKQKEQELDRELKHMRDAALGIKPMLVQPAKRPRSRYARTA